MSLKNGSKKSHNTRKQTVDLTASKGEAQSAKSAKSGQVTKGLSIANYSRKHDLVNLLALWPVEIEDRTLEGTKNVIKKLKSALRAERHRGQSGHWAYNLNRHIGLKNALEFEQETLKAQAKPQK